MAWLLPSKIRALAHRCLVLAASTLTLHSPYASSVTTITW